jgi:hypothetical protein
MNESVKGTTTPFALAILICDQVIVDEKSKKKTLVGVFDTINAVEFPANHPRVSIYARMTDAEGQYDFRIEHVQVKTDKLLFKGEILGVTVPDRLKMHELVLELQNVPLPESGEYEFRLWANDKYIGRVKFIAAEVKKQEDTQ